MVGPDVEPYWVRLRRLRTEMSLTEDDLVRRAPDGLSRSTIQALQRPYESQRQGRASSSRYPSAETFERVSAALGVPPDTFPEYRLAKAREQLDERHSSLGEAVSRLDRITEALLRQAAERSATTAKRQAGRHHTLEATPPAEANPEEAG